MAVFNRVVFDTRRQQLAVFRQQGTDGIDVLQAHLDRDATISDLRDELQRTERPKLLHETATAGVDVGKKIDFEAQVERRREQDAIDAEQRAALGAHVKTADAVNLQRLRESGDVAELRTIIEAARNETR